MSCAAPAARPRAGLRAFFLSLPHPRRLARRISDGHVLAGRALLLVLALALLAAQIEVHAHALTHLAETTRAAANDASPGEEDRRHAGALCLECLALAALELPPAAPATFTCDDDGAALTPTALAPSPSSSSPRRPRCRAPPSSALRPIPC